ncbi:hypothetical protein Taro_024588 [Colocasia esculenta]|uniref:Uncharacterized protein n=1 Tax=Colocasia esculenta TaxID=4460 RepID=A0A843V0R5_COLES|nr:hypothetical protein [Colocasia esculenta]
MSQTPLQANTWLAPEKNCKGVSLNKSQAQHGPPKNNNWNLKRPQPQRVSQAISLTGNHEHKGNMTANKELVHHTRKQQTHWKTTLKRVQHNKWKVLQHDLHRAQLHLNT